MPRIWILTKYRKNLNMCHFGNRWRKVFNYAQKMKMPDLKIYFVDPRKGSPQFLCRPNFKLRNVVNLNKDFWACSNLIVLKKKIKPCLRPGCWIKKSCKVSENFLISNRNHLQVLVNFSCQKPTTPALKIAIKKIHMRHPSKPDKSTGKSFKMQLLNLK